MCTIAILHRVVADSPLVIAANRDELYARPTRGPAVIGDGVVGGIDELSGGTWLAVHASGRFAAVTNQRALAPPAVGLRSRGLIVRALIAAPDPVAYVAAIDPTHHASMNLVWGDARGAMVAYLRQDAAVPGRRQRGARAAAGVHVLCNDRLGAPGFPRGARLAAAIHAALAVDPTWRALVDGDGVGTGPLARALGDHARVPHADVPPSHLPAALARELTATCIHSEFYGTRSATLLALGDDRVLGYRHADGPPCVMPFQDGDPMIRRSTMTTREATMALTTMTDRVRKLVVAGLIVGADGRVLITQRRADQSLPLQWEFPGGKVEAGEAPVAALARELAEEIGVIAHVGRIWDVLFHSYPAFDLVMLVYVCQLAPGEVPRPVEVADLVWVTPAELPGAWDILPADRPLVERLIVEGSPR